MAASVGWAGYSNQTSITDHKLTINACSLRFLATGSAARSSLGAQNDGFRSPYFSHPQTQTLSVSLLSVQIAISIWHTRKQDENGLVAEVRVRNAF
jgi:hypothetical protein